MKKLAQVSGQSRSSKQVRKQHLEDMQQEAFENDLIQEEAAMEEAEKPLDESQLMIKNLEENTEHLQKAAEESLAKATLKSSKS